MFLKSSENPAARSGKELTDLRGEIELRNVCFAYPTRDVLVRDDQITDIGCNAKAVDGASGLTRCLSSGIH